MTKLISKLPSTPTSIFSIMSGLAREEDALNLSQGFPDFDCSPSLLDHVQKYLCSGYNQYAPMQGVPVLREALASKIESLYQQKINFETEITITSGATQALYTAISALVHPGDEVIVLEPCYDSYIPAIKVNGGVPVHISLEAPSYNLPWNEIREAVTEKTRMIIINSPHNPTGSIISKEDIKELEQLVLDHNIFVLSDEVYEHLSFENQKHHSVLVSDLLMKNSLACFSFGKVLHTTGWKLGYVVGDERLMREFRKVHQFNVFSCNTPMQYGIADFIKEEEYLGLPDFFQKKRDILLDAISGSRFTFEKASGTYFQLLYYGDISQESDLEFAKRLTREHKLASIPISAFYHDAKDDKMIRLCFAKSEEVLQKAGEIISSI